MFITHAPFKHPLQLDRQSTTWYAVELALHMPLFLVTSHGKDEDANRIFMLHGMNELMSFAEQQPAGKITALHLLQPPPWSESGDWVVKEMREILLQQAPPDGSRISAVAKAADGSHYGGFPVERMEGDLGPLLSLLDLLPSQQHRTSAD